MSLNILLRTHHSLAKSIPLVVGGFLVCLLMNCSVCCVKFELYPYGEPQEENIDTEAINSIANQAESAFLSGSNDRIRDLMTEESWLLHGKQLDGQPMEKLKAYGEALKSRKLMAATDIMAEFSIPIGDESYTITFWKGSADSWTILRF